jgi:hypothetical protein
VLLDFYRTAHPDRPPLRVGLLLDGPRVSRFAAGIIQDIRQSDFARIAYLVYKEPEAPRPPAPWYAPLADAGRRKHLAFTLYQKLDRRWFPIAADPTEAVDCSRLLAGVDQTSVAPIVKGFTDRFPPEAVAAIRARDLDVILRFGFRIIRGDILEAARYGVWSFHHDDNEFYRGGPAQFWELVEGNPLSGVTLQVLTDKLDAGQVLTKGIFATRRGLSLRQNRVRPYFASRYFVIQKLKELHEHGWDRLRARMLPDAPYQGRRTLYRRPTNGETAAWLVPALARKALARPFRKGQLTFWNVALRRGGDLAKGRGGLEQFHWLEPPAGHFWADPFLVRHGGATWLFFEDFIYADKLGVISAAELDGAGRPERVREVLRRPYHQSYPFVFEHEGRWYLIPETGRNHAVELYQADDFPRGWRLQKVLASGFKAIDPTLWIDGDRCWWFITVEEPVGAGQMLLLFWSDGLLGEWHYHPANPISADVRNVRGAGRIFADGGRLIRPSQDCALSYGHSFRLNQIETLDERGYRERPLAAIAPGWVAGMVGTHTYNRAGDWEAIDGCWHRRPERGS